MEIKVNIVIEAPELTAAINNLAAAFSSAHSVPTVTSTPAQTSVAAQTSKQAQTQTAVPTAPPPQFTIDQIMQAGAKLMDAGKANDLIALLRTFGVRAVMDLKPEQIGAFATAMRELGAEI